MRKLLLASVATLGATLAMTGGAKAQPVKPVAPGTMVVHLNGYLQFEIGDSGSTYNTIATPTGSDKLNPISTIGDFRFYPGFDAQTVNNINYGVQVELRTSYTDASVGQNGKPGAAGATPTDSLYVKRAYGYLGTVNDGYVRFGQTDSAFTLLQAGVVEAFGDGGQWTLEGAQALLFPSNAAPASTFIYADQTAVYATDKLVYISPAFDGFSVAGGYEPNSNGIKEGYANCTAAASTCAALSSSNTFSDTAKRRKNTVDVGGQYLNTINGYKIKASVDYLHGAPIGYDGTAALPASAPYGLDELSVYQFGGQVTFAGLTLGANLKGGQVLDGYAFKPKGSRDAMAYIIGASYVIGPYVVGASYYNSQSAGTSSPGNKVARTLSEYGLAVGANYVITPNISLFTQYEYGHRHQPGNATTTLTNKAGNTQVQGISVGTTIKW